MRQYEVWVEARRQAGITGGWHADRCSWKGPEPAVPSRGSTDPCRAAVDDAVEYTPWLATKPIRCVDWCEAEAFCNHYGATLCSRAVAGGTWEPDEQFGYQWELACSADHQQTFAWGSDLDDAAACRLLDADGSCRPDPNNQYNCGPSEVGTWSNCATPQGVMDLSGNVREWTQACEATRLTVPDGVCATEGGSYATPARTGTCSTYPPVHEPKSGRASDVGFRCCREQSASELLLTGQ